jgi:hypothetical protein
VEMVVANFCRLRGWSSGSGYFASCVSRSFMPLRGVVKGVALMDGGVGTVVSQA